MRQSPRTKWTKTGGEYQILSDMGEQGRAVVADASVLGSKDQPASGVFPESALGFGFGLIWTRNLGLGFKDLAFGFWIMVFGTALEWSCFVDTVSR